MTARDNLTMTTQVTLSLSKSDCRDNLTMTTQVPLSLSNGGLSKNNVDSSPPELVEKNGN